MKHVHLTEGVLRGGNGLIKNTREIQKRPANPPPVVKSKTCPMFPEGDCDCCGFASDCEVLK